MQAEGKVAPVLIGDGVQNPLRLTRQGALVAADGQGRYYENTARGQVFSLVLTSWTTGVAAGNLVGAAAAASTNFTLWNPTGSGKNISVLKFASWVVGTLIAQDPLYHGYMTTPPTNATTVVTPIAANNVGLAPASVARALTSAAGTALTGNSAPAIIRVADVGVNTAGAATNVAAATKPIEYVDGDIVIPPGTAYIPLWGLTAAAMTGGYSITWEEIPV